MEKNKVANILQCYAILNGVSGAILALIVLSGYSVILSLMVFIITALASFGIYAIGEVIQLLHEIKLNTLKTQIVTTHTANTTTAFSRDLPKL